jgi:hypothetical protein
MRGGERRQRIMLLVMEPGDRVPNGVDPPMKARSQDSVILSFFLSGLFWTPASVKRSP